MIDCDNCTHNLVCNREQHLKEECIFYHGECRTCKNFVRGGLDGKTYVCEHPDIELDDYFDYACITMNENDFCSRYEPKEGEVK